MVPRPPLAPLTPRPSVVPHGLLIPPTPGPSCLPGPVLSLMHLACQRGKVGFLPQDLGTGLILSLAVGQEGTARPGSRRRKSCLGKGRGRLRLSSSCTVRAQAGTGRASANTCPHGAGLPGLIPVPRHGPALAWSTQGADSWGCPAPHTPSAPGTRWRVGAGRPGRRCWCPGATARGCVALGKVLNLSGPRCPHPSPGSKADAPTLLLRAS